MTDFRKILKILPVLGVYLAQYFALLLSLTFHDPFNCFLGVARIKNYINGQLMSDDCRAALLEYFSIYFLQAKVP